MSAIAAYLLKRGYNVCGYDSKRSEKCILLEELGVSISYAFSPEIFENVGLAVFTNAISDDDVIFTYPRSLGIPCVTRAEILGEISLEKKYRIGVSGTHGKSTTTGMISSVLLASGLDPTIFVGADLPMIGGTFRDGAGDFFVFEACEYKDSFLSFFPTLSVVLNTELDHVDYFGNIENVKRSFSKFMDIPGSDGAALICADCENTVDAAKGSVSKIVTFSALSENADVYAKDIRSDHGFYSFDMYAYKKRVCRISLSVPGKVYVTDALAASAASYLSGVSPDDIIKGIKAYTGVKRRFECRGKCKNAVVADDYAHHPDEIRATLETASQMGFSRVTCVFQPHTYTRTQALFGDFVSAFSLCEEVIFADIYSAREEPIDGITAEALAAAAPNGVYLGDFEKIAGYLMKKDNADGDLILIMGAGDVTALTDMILTERSSSFEALLTKNISEEKNKGGKA